MKNAILFSRGRKVTKKTLGLFLFLFTLLFSAGVVSAQTCSLVAEDQISAAVDENCEATITVGAVLDGMMTSCPGGDLVVYIYDALGQEVASGAPAIVPEGYVGQSLTAIVLDNISGNMSNDCILDIYDNLVPTVECWQNLENTIGFLGVLAPTYNRVVDGSDDVSCSLAAFPFNNVRYDAMAFEVNEADTYIFDLHGGTLPPGGFFVGLYANNFNPGSACDDLLDTDFGLTPSLSAALVPGTTYYLVTSMYHNTQVGAYEYYYTANTTGRVQVAVPDCNYELYCYNDLDNSIVIRVADNCDSDADVAVVSELVNENNCISGWDDNIFRIINRTYRATDASDNNSADLPVTITVRKMPNFQFQNSVIEPVDLLVVTDNAIECDEQYPTNIYGNPDPSYSGAPTMFINNQEVSLLTPFMACNVTATYVDLPYTQNNSCIQQFARMWTVSEWSCQNPNNMVFPPFLQTIEIADTTDPIILCPADEIVNTNTQGTFDNTSFGTVNCGAEYFFPLPFATDNCQLDLEWDISVLNDMGVPVVFLDNVSLTTSTSYELPLGENTVIYRLYDGCNNMSECEFTVEVEDLTPPVAICQTFTTVGLTFDGEAEVPASSFDSGSYDDCQLGYIVVRRMDEDPNQYFDYVTFDCTDIGDEDLMVVLRVYDIFENWSECMVSVEVQDKLNPTIDCPDNVEVDCDYYYDSGNLSAYFGWPTAYDNCFVEITTDSIIDIDQCGEGSITRFFTATDPDGRTAECSQTITFVNTHHFACGPNNTYNPENSYGDITWPGDVLDIEGCIDPNEFDSSSPLHPNQSGYPVLNEDQCDMAGPAIWNDEVYVANDNELDSPGACFKVIRTWKVTDWCNRVNGKFATWEHDQILMVSNFVAPVFSRIIPDTTVCTYDITCSDGFIDLSMTAVDGDDCTENEDLKWQYKLDEYNDDAIDVYDIVSPVFNGNDLTVSGDFPIGTHRILWTVWDQCGNLTSQEHTFTIQNCKKPTPICFVGLATDLTQMPNGPAVMIKASYYNDNSYHTCDYPLSFSYSSDVNDTLRTYECDHIGSQEVEMWVTAYLPDGSILQDYCVTEIDIQDQFQLCQGGMPMVSVSGGVTDEHSNPVTGVEVALEGSEFSDQLTNTEGMFAFPEMPEGGSYNLRPELNKDHSNGVSTLDLIHVQKHLLGLKTIDSPYKMIAADVNNDNKISASDLLNSRELILGVTDIFENNTSWRFVRANYEFTNEANPLTETYPEFEQIENIQEDVNADFIAVKIGDITNDASLDGKPVIDSRNYNTLKMDVVNKTFAASDLVKVPVLASAFNQVNGFQFTLNYDQGMIEFNGMEAGVLNMGIGNYYNAGNGAVTVSWSRAIAVDVDDDAVLFTLTFEAKRSGDLHESIHLGSSITRAEAYDADLEKLDLELNFRNMDEEGVYALYQNTPNPFSDNTVIRFNMKKAGMASIIVYDLNGKVIKQIEGAYDKGIQEITLYKNDLPSNGMLYYQMNTDDFTATKKMILVK